MGYTIVSQPRAWWPIRFKGVQEDGTVVENEIRGRFIIMDEDEFKARFRSTPSSLAISFGSISTSTVRPR